MTIDSLIERTRYRRLILYGALLAVPACGSETGILVEVSRGQLAESPATLEFFIGVQDPVDVSGVPICADDNSAALTRFIDADATAERNVDVSGQDLADDPYRLLLRPEDNLPRGKAIMVVVVARSSGGEVMGVAQLDSAATFIDDQVLKHPVTLATGEGVVFAEGNGCVCARSEAVGDLVVAPSSNRDCDPAPAASDCDDDNPFVFPNAEEVCDGVDSNCMDDDAPFEGTTECYVSVVNDESGDEQCFYGTRQCNDGAGSAAEALGECVPIEREDSLVSNVLCERFEQCPASAEQFECATRQEATRTTTCTVRIDRNGELCPGRNIHLMAENTATEGCLWTLIGGITQGPYRAFLFTDPGAVIEQTVIGECAPILHIADHNSDDLERHTFVLRQQVAGQDSELWELKTEPELVTACPDNPLMSPGFTCDGLANVPVILEP